jgi:EEF1A N-terminal glycine/lysine methyltransferase
MIVGTALPSIVSMLAGASEVCVTDHPSSPALSSKTIVTNVQASFELAKTRNPNPIFSVEAHEWGLITDPFSKAKQNRYTRVIAADCLWMSSQHRNLVQSIAHFLCKESPNACALVVAGFHTGNNIVADFFKQFQTLKGRDNIAEELSVAEIYESDMNSERRPWQESRANENREDAKRCCVIAVIVRVRVV